MKKFHKGLWWKYLLFVICVILSLSDDHRHHDGNDGSGGMAGGKVVTNGNFAGATMPPPGYVPTAKKSLMTDLLGCGHAPHRAMWEIKTQLFNCAQNGSARSSSTSPPLVVRSDTPSQTTPLVRLWSCQPRSRNALPSALEDHGCVPFSWQCCLYRS